MKVGFGVGEVFVCSIKSMVMEISVFSNANSDRRYRVLFDGFFL